MLFFNGIFQKQLYDEKNIIVDFHIAISKYVLLQCGIMYILYI